MEVQTEVRQPARPASGKLSYFDKLMLNSNSRQAAEFAAGAVRIYTGGPQPRRH